MPPASKRGFCELSSDCINQPRVQRNPCHIPQDSSLKWMLLLMGYITKRSDCWMKDKTKILVFAQKFSLYTNICKKTL